MTKKAFKAALAVLVCVLFMPGAFLLRGQTISGREAIGGERATEIETLLTTTTPGASVAWDPQLSLSVGSGPPIPVDMADFKMTARPDGSLWGVAAFELGTTKKDYLENLSNFQAIDKQKFPTTIIVFRRDPSHKITQWKKLDLDPAGPFSRIQILNPQNWSANQWPVVSVDYTSYIPSGDSLIALEWYSLFDTNTGSFRVRTPAGFVVTHSQGPPVTEIFSTRRVDANNIEIVGNVSKKTITYPCTDPCVVDGPTLLSKWPQ